MPSAALIPPAARVVCASRKLEGLQAVASALGPNAHPVAAHTGREADCDALIALQPAVVILGTGPTQVFPPRDVLAAFLTRRVGVEFMDNAAAARTYNVLLGEGRKVAAAFVLA